MTEVAGYEEVWNMLDTIRWAIEDSLPEGLIASVDETKAAAAAEPDAITTAISKLGAMLPLPTLTSSRAA